VSVDDTITTPATRKPYRHLSRPIDTPVEQWDEITVVEAIAKPLRKGYVLDELPPDSPLRDVPRKPKKINAPNVKTVHLHRVTIGGIHDLAKVLEHIAAHPYCAVVRGQPKGGVTTEKYTRRLSAGANATLTEHPRRWLALDFDGIPCPEHIDPTTDVDEIVDHLVALLPEQFAGVTCVWNLTGSAGMKGVADANGTLRPAIYARLWFWLDRPLGKAELDAWLAGRTIDFRVFVPAQINFTAAPEFIGIADPVPRRWGIWCGHSDIVEVPAIDVSQRAQTERKRSGTGAAPTGGAGLGYEGYKALIGDHEGGKGFHPPTMQAIGAYFGKHGSTADAEWLRADLEAAYRAANSSRHTPEEIEQRILALPNHLEDIRVRQEAEEKDRAEAKPAGRVMGVPDEPAPTLSVAEARARAAEAAANWADYAKRWNAARLIHENHIACGLFSGLALPWSAFWQFGVAVGKTKVSMTSLLPLAVGGTNAMSAENPAGESIIFAVPVHKLTAELKDRLETEARLLGLDITVEIYRGRDQDDPEAPLNEEGERPKMCPIRVETGKSVQQALTPQEKTCKTPGRQYCPMYKTCGGQRQRRKRADIWVIPHALLTLEHGRPEMIGRPRAVVVDESCRNHVAQGFSAERSLMLFEVDRWREVPGKKEDTQWLHETMRKVEQALTGAKPGPNGEIEMRVFTEAGLDFKGMERAVGLLYETKAPVNGSRPP
jgi:hypothetical protein